MDHVALPDVLEAYEMVGHALHLVLRGFVGYNIETAIRLHRVCVDDLCATPGLDRVNQSA